MKGIQNVLSRASLESTPSCSFCATRGPRKRTVHKGEAGKGFYPPGSLAAESVPLNIKIWNTIIILTSKICQPTIDDFIRMDFNNC